MVPYWVDQSLSQRVFPNKTLSNSCTEYEVDGDMTFGHGFLDISRAHSVSFMGAFVEGVLCHLCAMQHFSSPLFSFIFYGTNIECYVQWKVKSTTIPLEVKNTLSDICTRK